MTGVTAIGDYGREIFNRDIYEVRIGDKQDDNDHRRAADWITKSQNTIQSLYCDLKLKDDNDLDFVLENFNYTEKLFLYEKPSEHYTPAKPPNFQIDSLHVYYSFWIKQNHLITMNCKYIWLEDSMLSSRDLNVFLKHWLAGGCFQLKEFLVYNDEPIDYAVVLGGVEFVERERDVERIYVDEDESHHTLRGGFDTKRSSDNVTATITNGGDNSFIFLMFVWPDFAGNSY